MADGDAYRHTSRGFEWLGLIHRRPIRLNLSGRDVCLGKTHWGHLVPSTCQAWTRPEPGEVRARSHGYIGTADLGPDLGCAHQGLSILNCGDVIAAK